MLRIPRFQLFRMGSDPEFLFAKRADLDYIITPANVILGKDKVKTTHSFIGTDNRPVIAEIRPTPARNLKRHIYDLAYAVSTAQEYVDVKHRGHVLLACPVHHNEALGGHIHVSGYLDDERYLQMAAAGYTLGVNDGWASIPGQPPGQLAPTVQHEIRGEMMEGTLLTPYRWAQVLNWLLAPFEFWMMPWVQRERRNQHYGGPESPDVVRPGTSTVPFLRTGFVYVHWEYRLPSTWLHHPYLAMAYLALVKLVMLNFRWVANEYAHSEPKRNRRAMPGNESPTTLAGGDALYNFTPVREAENTKYYALFTERLTELQRSHPVITPDISDVFRMVELCGANREKWFSSARPIEVGEWRRLL